MSLTVSGAAAAYGGLNGYWGQSAETSGFSLRNYCDTGVQYATLAFVNLSPEQHESGYPGINFSSHCGAEVFTKKDGTPSKLLKNCPVLKKDIKYCQEKGVKVLLSIGGATNAESNVTVSYNEASGNINKGNEFAELLYDAFGPYREGSDVSRPFDSPGNHVAVDGFDFDLEFGRAFDNTPYIQMVEKLRELDSNLIITAAPECPLSNEWFHMKDMIKKAAFDALFVQYYNNPSCGAGDENENLNSGFNFKDWVDFLPTTAKNKDAKVFVGLLGSTDAAGSVGLPGSTDARASGYVTPETVKQIVCDNKDSKNWGGISLWDFTKAAANKVGDKNYLEHVQDALQHGCNSEPRPASATDPKTTATASTAADSLPSLASSQEPGKPKATSTESAIPDPESDAAESLKPPKSETDPTESSVLDSLPNLNSSQKPGKVEQASTESAVPDSESTATGSQKPAKPETVPTESTVREPLAAETRPKELKEPGAVSAESAVSDPESTVTSLQKPANQETVETESAVRESVAAETGTNKVDAHGAPSVQANGEKSSKHTSDVRPTMTATAFTTVLNTVTTCPPEVANCPGTTHVVTETVPLTTSTVYTTRVHTITACAPQVTDCHAGKVTTETVSVSTTVCPVTLTPLPEKTAVPVKSAVSEEPQPAGLEGPVIPEQAQPADQESHIVPGKPTVPKVSLSGAKTTKTPCSRPKKTGTQKDTAVLTVGLCPPGVTNCPGKDLTAPVATSTLESAPEPETTKISAGQECSGTDCPKGTSVSKVPGSRRPRVKCTSKGKAHTDSSAPLPVQPSTFETQSPGALNPKGAPAKSLEAGAIPAEPLEAVMAPAKPLEAAAIPAKPVEAAAEAPAKPLVHHAAYLQKANVRPLSGAAKSSGGFAMPSTAPVKPLTGTSSRLAMSLTGLIAGVAAFVVAF